MGFGGLLSISAERLGSRELIKFLFDRVDTKTMVIELGTNKRTHITPHAVNKVLGIPDSGGPVPLQTNIQA